MKLSRRRFLQAGSATLLLPLLESDSQSSETDAQFIFFVVKPMGSHKGMKTMMRSIGSGRVKRVQ